MTELDKILLRPLADADIAAIADIYGHHVTHGTASFETVPPALAEMQRRIQALQELRFPYLVAEQANEVIGYAYAGTYRPRAAYRDTVENSVYLRAGLAGRGTGTKLLAALVEACAAAGFRQMIAVVGDSANIPSIRLHERQGFRRIGVLQAVGYKHGRWLDTVLLQRTLGAGNTASPDRV